MLLCGRLLELVVRDDFSPEKVREPNNGSCVELKMFVTGARSNRSETTRDLGRFMGSVFQGVRWKVRVK